MVWTEDLKGKWQAKLKDEKEKKLFCLDQIKRAMRAGDKHKILALQKKQKEIDDSIHRCREEVRFQEATQLHVRAQERAHRKREQGLEP